MDKLNSTIGEFLVKRKLLTSAQIEQVLEIQKQNPEMKFGEIAVVLNYIDTSAINQYITYLHANK